MSDDGEEEEVEVQAPSVVNCSARVTLKDVRSVSTWTPAETTEWLVAPLTLERFFSDFWQKGAVVIKRGSPDFYRGLFSKDAIDGLLRTRGLQYGRNVDLARYSRARGRTTHNGAGAASAADVWRQFAAGCSVRVLHPQRWVPQVHALLASLEGYFSCAAGCNTYLTPGGTQGFAPHFDDIDAFVLQLEGRKRWRLHPPLGASSVLPRFSSGNFTHDEVGAPMLEARRPPPPPAALPASSRAAAAKPTSPPAPSPFLPAQHNGQVVLEPGDLLYMPRGLIHQADTEGMPGHSLHATVSTYHRQAWADLLEMAIPRGLEDAIEECPELREGIPLDTFDLMGIARAGDDGGCAADYDSEDDGGGGGGDWSRPQGSKKRRRQTAGPTPAAPAFPPSRRAGSRARWLHLARAAASRVFDRLPWDAAADQLCARFQRTRLPPPPPPPSRPSREEAAAAVSCASLVRLAFPHAARLVLEGDSCAVYHPCENDLRFHMAGYARAVAGAGPGEAPPPTEEEEEVAEGEEEDRRGKLVFPAELGPALEALVTADAEPVRVGDLPLQRKKDRSALAAELVRAGCLEVVGGVGREQQAWAGLVGGVEREEDERRRAAGGGGGALSASAGGGETKKKKNKKAKKSSEAAAAAATATAATATALGAGGGSGRDDLVGHKGASKKKEGKKQRR